MTLIGPQAALVVVVPASTTSALICPGTSVKASFIITNADITGTLYVLMGTGVASSTHYSVAVPKSGGYVQITGYSGPLQGVWVGGATGSAMVTTW